MDAVGHYGSGPVNEVHIRFVAGQTRGEGRQIVGAAVSFHDADHYVAEVFFVLLVVDCVSLRRPVADVYSFHSDLSSELYCVHAAVFF